MRRQLSQALFPRCYIPRSQTTLYNGSFLRQTCITNVVSPSWKKDVFPCCLLHFSSSLFLLTLFLSIFFILLLFHAYSLKPPFFRLLVKLLIFRVFQRIVHSGQVKSSFRPFCLLNQFRITRHQFVLHAPNVRVKELMYKLRLEMGWRYLGIIKA